MTRQHERDLHHLQAIWQLYAASMTPQAICRAALGLPMTFPDLNPRQRLHVEQYLHCLGDQHVHELNTRTKNHLAQLSPEGLDAIGHTWLD